MKKILKLMSVCAAICLMAITLGGCGSDPKEGAAPKKLKIVATIFPEYDWVKNIMGPQFKNAEVTLLLNKGTDIHSYQPTVQDMMKVSDADLFIYVGGESDFWVKDALKNARNKKMQTLNLMEVLKDRIKTEDKIEGMQEEKEEEHGHDHAKEHEEAPEMDEHVWLSLKNAEIVTKAIAEKLSALDPDHAKDYTANLQAYNAKLEKLDKEYAATVQGARVKTVLFGDRFPFRYLVDDYGIKYYAAFVGCSAETEASFKTVSFLAKKEDELGLKSICTLEKSDQKIAKTIAENTKSGSKKLLVMDSMQATGEKEIAAGVTYLGSMEKNLQVLKEALE